MSLESESSLATILINRFKAFPSHFKGKNMSLDQILRQTPSKFKTLREILRIFPMMFMLVLKIDKIDQEMKEVVITLIDT